jgi:hypothetical protein
MSTGWGRQVRLDFCKIATQNAAAKTYTTPFASLSTANPNDDGQSNAEPTVANGYAAQAITWTAPVQPSNDAAAQAVNNAAINFGPSTAAFSTGASALSHVGIWNSSTTRTETAFLGRSAVAGGGFAVNAAGITYTLPASTGIVMGIISA